MQAQGPRTTIYCHIAGIDFVRVDEDTVLRARGQRAHPVGRLLHAGEPRGDDAAVPGAVRQAPGRAGWRTTPTRCSRPCARSRPNSGKKDPNRRAADAGAVQFQAITSTPSSQTSSRRAGGGLRTSSCARTASTCARRRGPKRVDAALTAHRRRSYLDLAFRPDSVLAVCRGLFGALPSECNIHGSERRRNGHRRTTKAVYTYMARDHSASSWTKERILKNVPTLGAATRRSSLKYVLEPTCTSIRSSRRSTALTANGHAGRPARHERIADRDLLHGKLRHDPSGFIAQLTAWRSRPARPSSPPASAPRHSLTSPLRAHRAPTRIRVRARLASPASRSRGLRRVVTRASGGAPRTTWVLDGSDRPPAPLPRISASTRNERGPCSHAPPTACFWLFPLHR